MKKLNSLRIVVLLALVVWLIKDKEYKILHLSNFSFTNMSGDIFYPILFILLGLFILLDSMMIRYDSGFVQSVTKSRSVLNILGTKIWGVERSVKLNQAWAPFSIAISIGVIIFGIVLFFI